MLVVRFVVCIYIVNLGYGFEGSFERLSLFRFQSQTLSGVEDAPKDGANRFVGTWLANLPIPLPKNYIQGIDTQKLDFERGKRSYLQGTWQDRGWWYFYLYALTIKVPIGTWLLVVLAGCVSLSRSKYSASWRDELVLLLPPTTVLLLVSAHTGFSIHFRYVLPVLPFAFIWASKVAESISFGDRKIACAVILGTFWSLMSSLLVFPHSLSYFNELAGGARGGHAHLLDSSIAWGQDLLYLRQWCDEHPNARPLHLAVRGIDPHLAGIEFIPTPPKPQTASVLSDEGLGPVPGWFAIDVNQLHPDRPGRLVNSTGQLADGDLSYFLQLEPVGRAGYSINIYHLSIADVNAIRSKVGLKQLPDNKTPAE